ncbi:MAG: Gfo/Idh/MocA family oxidoreductase [Polyangiales bacterium]
MDIINTALLSFGSSGRVFHAPLLQAHPGFRLSGCWERSAKTLTQFYPSATSYESLEQVLSDPRIDLVIVNTPTTTHYEYTREVLERGKHAVTEKAFTSTAEEAATLQELAQGKRCKLAVFHNRRWDSDFQSVRRVLQEGRLGDVVEASLTFARYRPELSPKTHKEEPGPGAGIIKDLGAHVIDQALLLFGMPDAVFADIATTRESSRVDDYFDILLVYADKRVHAKGGYFYKHATPEYTLFGKLGSFLKTRSDVQEAQLESGMTPDDDNYGIEPDSAAGRLYVDDAGRTDEQEIVSPRGNYLQFYDGVFESIVHGGNEPVTAAEGVRVMQIIDAAFESHRVGRLVRI